MCVDPRSGYGGLLLWFILFSFIAALFLNVMAPNFVCVNNSGQADPKLTLMYSCLIATGLILAVILLKRFM